MSTYITVTKTVMQVLHTHEAKQAGESGSNMFMVGSDTKHISHQRLYSQCETAIKRGKTSQEHRRTQSINHVFNITQSINR